MLRRWGLALLERFTPGLRKQLAAYAAWRQRRRIDRQIAPVLAEITAAHGWMVQAGPFQGLHYVREARGSVLLPKLLGIYEHELADAISRFVSRNPEAVVDVGCAEGYYAIGLARLVPTCQVYAFDIDPRARGLCSEMATRNDSSDRVHVGERCDSSSLQAILGRHGRVLIVCDCEGYEDVLLDPRDVPGLRTADMLIEVHEFTVPGVTASLLERFGDTHHIMRIPAMPIDPDTVPAIAQYERETRAACTTEIRPPGMEWFVCLPLDSPR